MQESRGPYSCKSLGAQWGCREPSGPPLTEPLPCGWRLLLIELRDPSMAVVAVGVGIVLEVVVAVEAALSHDCHLSLWMGLGWR